MGLKPLTPPVNAHSAGGDRATHLTSRIARRGGKKAIEPVARVAFLDLKSLPIRHIAPQQTPQRQRVAIQKASAGR